MYHLSKINHLWNPYDYLPNLICTSVQFHMTIYPAPYDYLSTLYCYRRFQFDAKIWNLLFFYLTPYVQLPRINQFPIRLHTSTYLIPYAIRPAPYVCLSKNKPIYPASYVHIFNSIRLYIKPHTYSYQTPYDHFLAPYVQLPQISVVSALPKDKPFLLQCYLVSFTKILILSPNVTHSMLSVAYWTIVCHFKPFIWQRFNISGNSAIT